MAPARRAEAAPAASGRVSWTLIPLHDRARWDEALLALPVAAAHRWAYQAALRHTFAGGSSLFVCEGSGGRFACPVAVRGRRGSADLYTPFGFAGAVGEGDAAVFREGWRAFASQSGAVASYVGLHPWLAPPALSAGEDVVVANDAFIWDLRPGPDGLLDAMSPAYRRRLRESSLFAADMVSDPSTAASAFVRLYRAFMRRRDAGAVYRLHRRTLQDLVSMPGALVLAYPRARPVAAILTSSTPHCAEWMLAAATEEGRRHLVPLVWQAALAYGAAGIPAFNLGGGIRRGDGVAEAKRRLGAASRPLAAITTVFRPERFAELCRQAGITDPDARGYFPPYRAPDLRMARLAGAAGGADP